ncbi:MAG: response regulator [Lachnospiraceae bacterium]|nr:response regulator [Lachnospiraceae bacterium]
MENSRPIEIIILVIYTLYTLAMFLMTVVMEWGSWSVQMMLTGLVLSWVVTIQKYKDYKFRAYFTAAMVWMNFIIYGIHSPGYEGLLSMMCAITVLLGLYFIPGIVPLSAAASLFLLLYHAFIVSSIQASSVKDIVRLVLQISGVGLTTCITWYLIKMRAESNEELLDTIETLQRAEKSKDDFLANVSHEIRTPINTVCGMSEMVLREEIPERVRKDIFNIQTAGRNLLSVVSDVLDFSELESGKMELVEEPYNITSTINDIINMSIARKNGKRIELIVDCEATIPCGLVGDEQKLRRAIMNIVDNAIKFTSEGGIVITVASRKEKYGINLCIGVRDTGIGMNAETIEKLFTSFNQVDTKRNRQEGGIGLGLAITSAIVDKMGGFVSVKSVPEKGSELQVVIPQKVFDEHPIISVRDSEKIYIASYIDMEKYDYMSVREGYQNMIQHMVEQLGLSYRSCQNLAELKRRIEKENFTHVFISWEEYCEDQQYFEELSYRFKVILVHDRESEECTAGAMFHIYKPFYVLSIASVLNGENVVQSMDGSHYQNRRFVAPQASVLVVDDNVMNLRVVEGLLRPYRIKVFVAGSGREALQKIESMEFDFVFMDHMMPEMDGVETLHRIRKKPGRYFQEVPVIALTANAIGGAREMFLSEGFADFVAKPIEISVLERVLRRHIPEKKVIKIEEAEGLEEADGAVSPEQSSVTGKQQLEAVERKAGKFQIEDLDVETALHYCGGQLEDYIDIARIYYTSGLKKKAEMEEAYAKRNWNDYAIMTHSLKSMSLNIGAQKLSDMAKGLETAAKAGEEAYILLHHAETIGEYSHILSVIGSHPVLFPEKKQDTESGIEQATEAVAQGQQAAEQKLPEMEREVLWQEIDKLQEQLDRFEYEEVQKVLDGLWEKQYQGVALSELLQEVKEKADAFDFMGAGEKLQEAKEKMR